MAPKLKIRKGDEVVVRTGKDKGKKGSVIQVFPKEQRVRVSGVNIAKRHTSASRGEAGGIIEKEISLHISNVGLADPKTGKPTRVGKKLLADGSKVRFAKSSGEVISEN